MIVGEFIGEYFSVIATGVYYGPCLFNYLYGTHYYKPLLVTQQHIDALLLTYKIESIITMLLVILLRVFAGFST